MVAILEAIKDGQLSVTCPVVISNKPDAKGLDVAKTFGVSTMVINYQDFNHAEGCEAEIVKQLQKHGVQMVVLAGFMRLLKGPLLEAYQNRILNIHPSLLPKFKGMNAQLQALESGDQVTGCTVHVVTKEMDAGPIIMQTAVPILDNDTQETLSQRILEQEHQLYPKAIQAYIQEVSHESVN